MKIKYEFVTETIEIEVPDEWGNVVIDLDRLDYNNDHAETRRHCSLHELNLDDTYLPSDVDVVADVIRNSESEDLHRAISQLKPQQQELIHAIYFEGMTVSEYGKRYGITHSAVSQRKDTAIKKLKKFLKKT